MYSVCSITAASVSAGHMKEKLFLYWVSQRVDEQSAASLGPGIVSPCPQYRHVVADGLLRQFGEQVRFSAAWLPHQLDDMAAAFARGVQRLPQKSALNLSHCRCCLDGLSVKCTCGGHD